METELLSADYITKILRISIVTAHRWCCDRRLAAAKIVQAYRISKEALDEWYEGKLRESMAKLQAH